MRPLLFGRRPRLPEPRLNPDRHGRLSSVSCQDQAERANFRRVPRLSRKVTLFVTASTHAARRDELDLFVRHLFNLPQTVTLHPLVQEFFDIKPNGLDGQLPPSPAPHTPAHFEQHPNGKTITPASAAAASSAMREFSYSASTSYASIKERSPGPPQPAFRAGLVSKRSTPDLRRFMSASVDSSASSSSLDEDLPNMSCPTSPAAAAYPAQLAFRFPMPPAPHTSTSQNNALVSPLVNDNDVTVRYSAHAAKQPSSSSQTQGTKQRSGLGRDTFVEPRSPASGTESGRNSISDAFSVRTASTARPVCGGGPLSRVASPMSFTSDRTARQEDEEEERHSATTTASPPPPSRPAPRPLGGGSLKHFRSLQDLRSVVTPRPQLPPVPTSVPAQPMPSPPSTRSQQGLYVPPPMTRARSDSKVMLSKPLPLVLEDEPPAPSPTSSKGFRRWNNTKQPNTPASSTSTRFARPSLDNLRRLAQEQFGSSNGHQHTPSTSSVESSDSSLPSLSRSQTSSAGLGFDFSSPSYESLELSSSSDHSGYFDSPDSSFTVPTTPPSAFGHQQGRAGKFDRWQQDGSSGSYLHNGNNMPPMPFFPTPGACDAIAYNQGTVGRRHGLGLGQGQGRSRASSLHHPTLETILASPILGCEPASKPSPRADTATVTIKLMTAHDGNFMMKLPKSASLQQLRERVYAKCRDSDVALDSARFALTVQSAGAGSGTATAKSAARLLDSAPSSPASPRSPGSALAQAIDINDEEDWQLALSLATTKLTLRVR